MSSFSGICKSMSETAIGFTKLEAKQRSEAHNPLALAIGVLERQAAIHAVNLPIYNEAGDTTQAINAAAEWQSIEAALERLKMP